MMDYMMLSSLDNGCDFCNMSDKDQDNWRMGDKGWNFALHEGSSKETLGYLVSNFNNLHFRRGYEAGKKTISEESADQDVAEILPDMNAINSYLSLKAKVDDTLKGIGHEEKIYERQIKLTIAKIIVNKKDQDEFIESIKKCQLEDMNVKRFSFINH